MNPFHHTLDDDREYCASLQDLLGMVQDGGLSDPELDALCAAACDGLYVEERDCIADGLYDAWWDSYLPFGTQWGTCPKFTSDGREAMRLLVKYRLNVQWGQDTRDPSDKTLCVLKSINPGPIDLVSLIPDMDLLGVICRAITLAAVAARLREMIEKAAKIDLAKMTEGDGDAND